MLDKMKPNFDKGGKFEKLYPLFEAGESFYFVLPHRTKSGAHIRDNMDMKRLMSVVIVALLPCLFFGMYNVGYQHFLSQGLASKKNIIDCMLLGARYVMPIVIVSYTVGGIWEVLFACVRKHEINEGFLVTGMLVPLILPPDIPLWKLAVGISFGVIIGKEVFGGTGMNIFNPALVTRAFLFFAYAGDMSGDTVWVADMGHQAVQGFSGATPLAQLVAHAGNADMVKGGVSVVNSLTANGLPYTWQNMFIGIIPGSIGETSTLCCVIGAVVLIASGIGSWRIMAGILLGTFGLTWGLNALATNPASMMAIPPYIHLVMGGYAFGLVFMATDPVSASQTKCGKWVYGIIIGVVVVIVRIFNTAFPEGMMLSILFANVFASMIDYFVVQAHIKRRSKRCGAEA